MCKFALRCLLFMLVVHYVECRPNILFIVADDLGWNDVGFHNPSMLTSNIDKLAYSGVIFNQSYVQPVCSPSRTAFLTGMYPFKLGLQHSVIGNDKPVCVPLNRKFLPQYLKNYGYTTHAIGKWHLGFCNWDCTPTERGFDSFFGFYTGVEDYYTHISEDYLDYRINTRVNRNLTGVYSAFVYAEEASRIIENNDGTTPFFIYLPFQSVHFPIQVPKKYEELYPNIVNTGRRKLCGMVSALDEAIGSVITSLKKAGVYDNTLIFFTSDNGGEPTYYGTNLPLRGGKNTIWEGGTRGVSFAHGAGLKETSFTFNGMMHAVDFLPTILSAVGADSVKDIDGVSQWESIKNNLPSERSEFIYNLDDYRIPITGQAAIRVGDMKLIDGYPGLYDGWIQPMNDTEDTIILRNIFNKNHKPTWLFNITADPTERHNLANEFPEIVDSLRKKILKYKEKMIPANTPPRDSKSNPQNFGGVWSPGWC